MCDEQCPICYQSYSDDDNSLSPRRLNNCHDVMCRACLEENIFEGECYCPQCGSLHSGCSVDDISVPYVPASGSPSASEEAPSDVSPPPEEVILADSLHANSPPTRGNCQAPGCHRRTGISSDGFCLKHTTGKKRTSLLEETEIAESLEATKLGQFSIDGTKMRLMDPLVAGSAFNPADLAERFSKQSRMELGEVVTLLERGKNLMKTESNVLKLEAPLVVVGDIHGQFYDLVNMLEQTGSPGDEDEGGGRQYIFLGDYVDRGHFSCEVMLLLLALKVAYPSRVWLLRGNHECRSVSGVFGFKEECKKKYGVAVYYGFLSMFQTMPLAAIISTDYGNMFACHGGISPSLNLVEDIENLDRFVEPESNAGLLDVLWSDPLHDSNVLPMDYDEEAEMEYHKFLEIDWRPNPTRGCSYCFGYAAIVAFLQNNNFVCLLRAHEVQENGFHEHFQSVVVTRRVQATSPRATRGHSMDAAEAASTPRPAPGPCPPPAPEDPYVCLSKEVSGPSAAAASAAGAAGGKGKADPCIGYSETAKCLPMVITVFSAPNYCDRYENKGAVLTLGRALSDFQFVQYDCVEHPVPDDIDNEMNNQIAAVVASCPYMPTSFQDFVRLALELGFEEDLFEDDESGECAAEEGSNHSMNHSLNHSMLSTDNIVIQTKDGIAHPMSELDCSPAPKPLPLCPPAAAAAAAAGGPASAVGIAASSAVAPLDTAGAGTGDSPGGPTTPTAAAGVMAAGAASVGLGTPPLNPSFTSPGGRPTSFGRSKSIYTSGVYTSGGGLGTPDHSKRPPLAKTPSDNALFSPCTPGTAARRGSMGCIDGYVRQRVSSIESLKIQVGTTDTTTAIAAAEIDL
jgi:diadenosine tetraphosphatase ApaH/serine/threonine PP2A family protein phosphatase